MVEGQVSNYVGNGLEPDTTNGQHVHRAALECWLFTPKGALVWKGGGQQTAPRYKKSAYLNSLDTTPIVKRWWHQVPSASSERKKCVGEKDLNIFVSSLENYEKASLRNDTKNRQLHEKEKVRAHQEKSVLISLETSEKARKVRYFSLLTSTVRVD